MSSFCDGRRADPARRHETRFHHTKVRQPTPGWVARQCVCFSPWSDWLFDRSVQCHSRRSPNSTIRKRTESPNKFRRSSLLGKNRQLVLQLVRSGLERPAVARTAAGCGAPAEGFRTTHIDETNGSVGRLPGRLRVHLFRLDSDAERAAVVRCFSCKVIRYSWYFLVSSRPDFS